MFVPHFPEKLSVVNEAYCKYLSNFFDTNLEFDDANYDDFSDSAVLYEARVIAKDSGILAGLDEIKYFLSTKGILVKSNLVDGDFFEKGDVLLTFLTTVKGYSFKYERVILNLLSRMCGIATETSKYVAVLKSFQNSLDLLSTRKLVLGPLDKKAFIVGGGKSHRITQGQAIMIKKYHKNLYGLENILADLEQRNLAQYSFVEIELHNSDEVFLTANWLKELSTDIPVGIMLDNFDPNVLSEILLQLKDGNLLDFDFVEASGGIHFENLSDYDIPGLDFISVGSITKNSQAIDLSFDLERR